MQHTNPAQDCGTLVICKKLIIVVCIYYIVVSTFRWDNAKLKPNSNNIFENGIYTGPQSRDLAWSQGFLAL